jgi:hypothetical protein
MPRGLAIGAVRWCFQNASCVHQWGVRRGAVNGGWAEHWNDHPKPFIWKATAEDIIEKGGVGRLRDRVERESTSSVRMWSAIAQPTSRRV